MYLFGLSLTSVTNFVFSSISYLKTQHIVDCGKFMIFLSASARFYVKSILENLDVLTLPFLPF